MTSRWRSLLPFSLAIPLLALVAITVTEPWEWSYLMDEISFGMWMPAVPSVPAAFLKEVGAYWAQGRFTPVKCLLNLLRWRYVPLYPFLFHLLNLAVLLAAFLPLCLVLRERARDRALWAWAPWLGLVLAKPVLETVTFSTIAETPVIFFFGWGLWLWWRQRRGWARLFFLVAALSKEPALFVFAALLVEDVFARRWSWWIVLDAGVFAALLGVALLLAKAGTYVGPNYSVTAAAAVFADLVSFTKIGFFLFPLILAVLALALAGSWRRTDPAIRSLQRICLVFSLCYVVPVGPRGSVGYLLLPAAYGVFAALVLELGVEGERFQALARPVRAGLICAFFAMSALNLVLWWQLNRAVDEPSRFLRERFSAAGEQLVLINGREAVDQANSQARRMGSHVHFATWDDEGKAQAAAFRGLVYVLELTRYSGRLDDTGVVELAARRGERAVAGGTPRARIWELK